MTTRPPEPPPPDWAAPRTTLILAASPRSGSSWLATLIGSTGTLGRPDEWFGPWRTGGTRSGTIAAAHEAVARSTTPNGVAGIKLFPNHLAALQPHVPLFEWFPRTVWVHLQRRDLLGQAISLWRADASGAWCRPASGEENTPATVYSGSAIEAFLRQAAAYDADWRVFFARTGIEPLTLAYEEVAADPRRALRLIADALGETLAAESLADPGRLVIQRDALSIEARLRFHKERGDPDRRLRRLVAPPSAARAPRTVRNLLRFLAGRPLRL